MKVVRPRCLARNAAVPALLAVFAAALSGQTSPAKEGSKTPAYSLAPAFDLQAIDPAANPCQDFYKFACGRYVQEHPIPPDQAGVDQFYTLFNVNTQRLQGILEKYDHPGTDRTPNQQKIGDDYAACMNTELIDSKGLAPLEGLLGEVSRVSKPGLPYFAGELQRYGVTALFGFGEMQDFKDSTKQIAVIQQGGLGLPERDYYTRQGEKDKLLRQQYVDHIAKMLELSGEPATQAAEEARGILAFETRLATASMTNTEMRDPEATYHPQTLADFEGSLHGIPFAPFLKAIHSPEITSLNVATPKFFPAMVSAIFDTPLDTLRAYLRYHVLTRYASVLPKALDDENFHFYGTELYGSPQQRPRWKRCASRVDSELGEALGQVYVEQYFAGDSKAKTLEIVHDIEAAMDTDIDHLAWMGPETRAKAKAKLHAIADKIGYPEHWRDYSTVRISPTDAFGNDQRTTTYENDRQLAKIGQPVDRLEWLMTPPTINAYYDPSMNNINFPAGILQPAFYDPKADLATNYGHIGSIVGHELTHGFDDQGAKFDATGNLDNWWTDADKKNFETRTACLEKQYGSYLAVDDVHVNGKLTLGENTADNGGLLLAYMAYLDRAKKDGVNPEAKIDGYTGPQRFYIAYAQNWCENSRPEMVRQQVLTDPHSPDHFRANGAIVNQPGFAAAFSCKAGAPMAPAQNCRVW